MSVSRFEVKPMPELSAATKIVEAYGLGKCPKLVKQICGPNLNVRVNALEVLSNEFQNPYSIEGCAREGVISVLAEMVIDPDFTTRVRATNALFRAAKDANGLASILEHQDNVIPLLVKGVSDPSEVVRGHVYECILSITRTTEGIHACVQHEVTAALVSVLRKEVTALKPALLKSIHNIVSDEAGLKEAIEGRAVEACINLLIRSPEMIHQAEFEDATVSDAARTLGYMCYDERAKKEALEQGAVEKLINLLKDKTLPTSTKCSVTIALMAITIASEGKIQVHACGGVDAVMLLLNDDNRAVLLNALKIIGNLAVYPKNREAFLANSSCAVKLRKLSKAEDALVARHAGVALAAVHWTP
jgi:hypothetical protein